MQEPTSALALYDKKYLLAGLTEETVDGPAVTTPTVDHMWLILGFASFAAIVVATVAVMGILDDDVDGVSKYKLIRLWNTIKTFKLVAFCLALIAVGLEITDVASDWAFYVVAKDASANIDSEVKWLLALNIFITSVLCVTALVTLPTVLLSVCCQRTNGRCFVQSWNRGSEKDVSFRRYCLNFLLEVGVFRRLQLSAKKEEDHVHKQYVMAWTFLLGLQDLIQVIVTVRITNTLGWDNASFQSVELSVFFVWILAWDIVTYLFALAKTSQGATSSKRNSVLPMP